ncbi:hypothetical protein Zmor_019468 [Zophobas morio]|uniref:Uncharacterized protein n=1 Tax=Zophobas morio TaxID=2755281 RepID=A0AA38I1L6_9CUCU|nr:hypothetical protein Zmor_019468 [Zophobas morio]
MEVISIPLVNSASVIIISVHLIFEWAGSSRAVYHYNLAVSLRFQSNKLLSCHINTKTMARSDDRNAAAALLLVAVMVLLYVNATPSP